jgi:hypothetical protein
VRTIVKERHRSGGRLFHRDDFGRRNAVLAGRALPLDAIVVDLTGRVAKEKIFDEQSAAKGDYHLP